jgi:hypothetical protein
MLIMLPPSLSKLVEAVSPAFNKIVELAVPKNIGRLG